MFALELKTWHTLQESMSLCFTEYCYMKDSVCLLRQLHQVTYRNNMKVIAGTGFTFLWPLWLCPLASRITLAASTYKGTSTWALNKSLCDLQESLRSLLYIWAKALSQTLNMLFPGVQTLFRSPLTLFFCKTCSALLTLFRAWTLVDPFSFG